MEVKSVERVKIHINDLYFSDVYITKRKDTFAVNNKFFVIPLDAEEWQWRIHPLPMAFAL